MHGVIFTDFVEMLERRFSLRALDTVLSRSRLRSAGAYTTVGNYDHHELHSMVEQLSMVTGQSCDAILYDFGNHLFARLAARYPTLIKPYRDTFSLLKNLRTLTGTPALQTLAQSRHPILECEHCDGDMLRVMYRSERGLGALAHGLMQGCAEFFGEQIRIERSVMDGTHTCFLLTKQSAI